MWKNSFNEAKVLKVPLFAVAHTQHYLFIKCITVLCFFCPLSFSHLSSFPIPRFESLSQAMQSAGMLKKTKSVWPCNRRHSWTLLKKVSSRVQRATRMLLISSIYLRFTEKERVSERSLMVNICLYKSPDFTRQTLKFPGRTTGENWTRRAILSAPLKKWWSQRPLKKHIDQTVAI